MAKHPNSLKNLKPIKKGECRNPTGRPKDLLGHKMRLLTAEEFAEIANLIIKGSIDELRKIAKDDNQTALKVMLSAVAVKIISKGDMNALDTLLNRLVGKVKETVHHKIDTSSIVVLPEKEFREDDTNGSK